MPLPRSHAALRHAALLALLLAPGACSKSPTEPVPVPSVHRTVTVTLADSLGAPRGNTTLWWISLTDSAGFVTVLTSDTDSDGEDVQVLREGGWLVATDLGPTSAGATFVVAGRARAESDTQLVRLVTHTGSRAHGTCLLAGRTDHSGTLVSGVLPALGATSSDGAWSLEGLPLGRWTLTFEQFGFKLGIATVEVTTPGQNVTVPTLQLISDPKP